MIKKDTKISKKRIEEIKTIIQNSVDALKDKDKYKIVTGRWGIRWDEDKRKWIPRKYLNKNCLCPMACVLINNKVKAVMLDEVVSAAKYLNVTEEFITDFISGVDNLRFENSKFAKKAGFKLGKYFNKKLNLKQIF